MALVSDIQLQDGSVKPPKLDTTQKFTVAGLTATTALAVGETVPLSTTGLVTVKSANDITNWIQTTNTNGNVSLYLSNDARPDWALKVAGTASDSFIIANSYGANNTEQYPAFSIGTAGAVGVGKTGAGNIIDVAYANSTTGGIQLTETTNSVGVKLIGESTSGSIGTTTNHKMGFRVNGATQAAIDTSGQLGIGTDSPGAKLDVRGSATFNEGGAAVDFRVEGDTEANLLFVDGSADRVGIGTATPASLLHVDDGDGSNTVACFNGTINASCYAGEKEGHIIQCNFNNFTQRGGLSFNIDDVGTVTDCAGCDSTVVTINGANTCVCFFKCDGSNDDISLVGGSIGNALCNDTSPKLGGNLDVNNQCIINSNTDEGIRLVPNGAGRVIIDGLCWPASDGTAGYVLCTNGSGDLTWSPDGGSTWDVGSGVLFTNAGCKVGIGTSTPSDVLTVFSCAATTTWGLNVCDPHPACAYGAQIKVTGACTGFPALNVVQNSDTLFRVDTGGNVGIGTAAPTESLHVVGAVNANNLVLDASVNYPIRFENQAGTTADAAISTFDDANGTLLALGSNFYFSSGGAETRFNTSEEAAGIVLNRTGTISLRTSDGSNNTVERVSVGNTGDVTVGTGNLSLSTGFVTVAGNPSAGTISSNGNGQIGGLTGNGLYMYGKGSTYDLALANANTTVALAIPTGGSATPDVYITNSLGIGTATAAGTLHAHLTSDKNIRMQVLGAHAGIGALNDDSSSYIQMNLEASDLVVSQYSGGNMGLGVVPSTWSVGKAFEIGGAGNALWYSGTTGDVLLRSNVYYNSGDKYGANGYATQLKVNNSGAFEFYTAPSGTANAAVTLTNRMTLTNGGLLGIGTTSPSHKLNVLDTSGSVVRLQGINSYNYDIESQGDGTLWDHEIGSGSAKFSWSSSSAELMRLDATGLGINTTSPSSYSADARNLVVASSGNGGVTIKSGTTSTGNIFFANAEASAANNGIIQYDHNTNEFAFNNYGSNQFYSFSIQGSEKLRLDATGLGIGTGSPVAPLHIIGSSGEPSAAHSSSAQLILENNSTAFIEIATTTGDYAGLTFSDNAATRGAVLYDHGSTLAGGADSLNFQTAGSVRANINSTGSLTLQTNQGAETALAIYNTNSSASAKASLKVGYDSGSHLHIYRIGNAADIVYNATQSGSSHQFLINSKEAARFTQANGTGGFTLKTNAGCNLITMGPEGSGGNEENGFLTIYGNGTQKINFVSTTGPSYINTGQNFGLGTTVPSYPLHIARSAGSTCTLLNLQSCTNSSEGNKVRLAFSSQTALDSQTRINTAIESITHSVTSSHYGDLAFLTMNAATLTEKMRITSAGNVGIGTTSPSSTLTLIASESQISISRTGSYSTSAGPLIQFSGKGPNGTNYNFGKIQAVSSGSNNAGELQFFTNCAGVQSERVRITSAGRLGIGTTAPCVQIQTHATGAIGTEGYLVSKGGIYIGLHPQTANESLRIFCASTGGGSSTLYIGNASINVTSDCRAKENIIDFTDSALGLLCQARVVKFNYIPECIHDESCYGPSSRGEYVGLIAQEAKCWARWSVNDGDGNPDGDHLWKAEYEHLVPLLIKATQELQEEVITLKSKVAALEAA